MELISINAENIALDFLMAEWEFSSADREWFSILSARPIGENWYVVEIGVEGLPDKWIFQVYDTGNCDPNYTFISPMSDIDSDLDELPERIAQVLLSERTHS